MLNGPQIWKRGVIQLRKAPKSALDAPKRARKRLKFPKTFSMYFPLKSEKYRKCARGCSLKYHERESCVQIYCSCPNLFPLADCTTVVIVWRVGHMLFFCTGAGTHKFQISSKGLQHRVLLTSRTWRLQKEGRQSRRQGEQMKSDWLFDKPRTNYCPRVAASSLPSQSPCLTGATQSHCNPQGDFLRFFGRSLRPEEGRERGLGRTWDSS